MKILIIGNGFDLAHGLPTRYTDFLKFTESVFNIYELPTNDLHQYELTLNAWQGNDLSKVAINQIKEQLKLLFQSRTASSTRSKCSLITDSTNVTVNERLDNFYSYLKNNVWYKYISAMYKESTMRGENWIDFESEISAIVQTIDEKHTSLTQTVSELHKILFDGADEELKLRLEKFTPAYGDVYGGSIESLGKVSDQRERLYRDLENSILAFEIYLADFVERVNVPALSEIQRIEPDCVISFNYTKTYERIYTTDEQKNICYIHGTCRTKQEREKTDNNMVIGINEYLNGNERFVKTDFSIFKKFVQRIRNQNDVHYASWFEQIEENGRAWLEHLESVESVEIGYVSEEYKKNHYNSSDIYIYGHSLDITDKDILKRFIDSEYTRVHIYAHSKPAEGDLISHLLHYVDEETVIKKASCIPCKLEFLLAEGK